MERLNINAGNKYEVFNRDREFARVIMVRGDRRDVWADTVVMS